MLFFRQRARETIAESPDVRPMILLLYNCFRDAGAQPIEAGEIAVGLVMEDLMRIAMIHAMDEKIVERIMIMDSMAEDTAQFNEVMQYRSRILFWLNLFMGILVSASCLLLLHQFFFH